ncbi:beta-carotene 2-hydroxylase CYP287A1 [Pilimelia columellifera subsp. columellifera]|uniref:Beta-carotene 2-hydroxylase CYP287A1 n=1 Tax=Pilimelia columellifera subsp. columellifera TaxID=706583 RepID=A0ABP6ADU6_9ACTN
MEPTPTPPARNAASHLWRWTRDPLGLLSEGARLGPAFDIRLWRQATVGYSPEWNQAVLTDLETFRSRGSLSGITPYLAAGIVSTDLPEHRPRRRALNRPFSRPAMATLAGRLRDVADRARPDGDFDALAHASALIQRMLNAALFGGRVDPALVAAFLRPLTEPMPTPVLRRPWLFRRMNTAIARTLADPPTGSVAAALVDVPGAVEELRVALAAGYDTTAHTLAWALWRLAEQPDWGAPGLVEPFLDEVQRLYPSGWIGSRVATVDAEVDGVPLPAGRLVLYSPYLTHRDPQLWPAPERFRPQRFVDGRPVWSYLPFSAGPRTCLGAHLARLMLATALEATPAGRLTRGVGDDGIVAGITLRPRGPLPMRLG